MGNPKLNHASVRIVDLAASRRFYEGTLGLSLAPRPELGFPGAWYSLGSGQLHLIQSPPLFDDIDPTNPHVAIEVDDLDAMRARLRAAGIAMRDFGGPQIWVLDPDGNTVELCTSAPR